MILSEQSFDLYEGLEYSFPKKSLLVVITVQHCFVGLLTFVV